MRTLPRGPTEQDRDQSFPPCVICGRRHDWHECHAKQRRERQEAKEQLARGPQRGGDPASLADVMLANKGLPAELRERLKARKEKADG